MLLKKGDNNEQVKQLQVKLHLDPVGNFGPKTEEAVKLWQSTHGLTADGIVGDKTWAMIMGEEEHPQVQQQAVAITNSTGLKLDKLKGHIPDAVIAMIPAVAQKFQIDSALRLAHFLAQCGHESGGFRLTKENLNYSAKGLNGIFKKYFPTLESALPYERKPEKIANKVYGGRMGNGPESTGDGAKFCGRGYIQLTGKDNYTAFGKSIGEDVCANPQVVAEKYALLSAAWFFSKNGLHKMADGGSGVDTVKAITKRVNGGYIGIEDRIKHFNEYYKLLS
jgi:putative chitinase